MTEKNFLTKTLTETVMTRRSFLKWSAALGGTAALAGGLNYGLKAVETAVTTAANEGKWVAAACWHNCGGRCLIKAHVVDGVVTRTKTDDTHPDSPDNPQQRGCARGHSQRLQTYAVDRLKYPMKRKNWSPGGGNKELRGKDEWVRISWDEALDLVSSEIKRIKDIYGSESILAWGPRAGEIYRLLDLLGGRVTAWGSFSTGTWSATGPAIGVGGSYKSVNINDRLDLRNSQLIVMWGMNPSWSSAGLPTYNYLQAKKAGAKFIYIDPLYNDTAQVLADEWIPIRPATDHTLALGIAHHLLTEDDPVNAPLIDWDFLNRCTIGFDADHMPEGVDPRESFKDYVLGTYDGQPKTPEWASEICGVPPEKIRSLAREIATTKRVALHSSFAPARVNNQDSWPQAFITLGCMTGHIGQPGRMTGVSAHVDASNGGPEFVYQGSNGVPSTSNAVDVRINYNELWDAILTGKYTAGKNDIRECNIQLIYHGGGSRLNQVVGIPKGIAAHRKVEFVVTAGHFLTTQAKYSDIVLPATTQWERYGVFPGATNRRREFLVWASQVIEPLYETRDDMWITKEIGKRLGLDPNEIDPLTLKQMIFNEVAGAMVIKQDGSGYEPLVTITAEDIAEFDVEGNPQVGRIPIKEWKEKGIYQVPRSPGDKLGYIALEEFRKDPEANPLGTTSGKIEIFCQAIADTIDSAGWTEIRPIPAYNKPVEGYEDTFVDWDHKVKGDYPLQLYTIHYPRRSHSIFDNIPWLRKAFPQEFFMNKIDAAERGIQQGDYVKVSSRHGTVIRPVFVTDRIMPGVTTLGQGAWVEMDDETGIDRAGATNTLNGAIPTGQGHAGWNSCNVQVQKYDQPLEPDFKWPQRIVFREA